MAIILPKDQQKRKMHKARNRFFNPLGHTLYVNGTIIIHSGSQTFSKPTIWRYFVPQDFSDLGKPLTVNKTLARLASSGKIRRIAQGLYDFPYVDDLLGKPTPASPYQAAKAIARSHHWTIVPSEENALNLLGLSDQIPAVLTYASDGPYKVYTISNTDIFFKHTAQKYLSGLSPNVALAFQALKAMDAYGEARFKTALLLSHLTKPEQIQLSKAIERLNNRLAQEIKEDL